MSRNFLQVELVYDADCPNVPAARDQLRQAFAEAALVPDWREWDTALPDAPARVRGYGSPTILVNGKDVSGEQPRSDAACCRIYPQSGHPNRGVPPLAALIAALRDAMPPRPIKTRGPGVLNIGALPAIGLALLPKLTCPACWPTYAAVLGSLGLGFVNYTTYLLPLTGLFLVVTLASLFVAARRRGHYAPFGLAIGASAVVVLGKFSFDSDAVLGIGVGLLVLASLWNTWPRRAPAETCPACTRQP